MTDPVWAPLSRRVTADAAVAPSAAVVPAHLAPPLKRWAAELLENVFGDPRLRETIQLHLGVILPKPDPWAGMFAGGPTGASLPDGEQLLDLVDAVLRWSGRRARRQEWQSVTDELDHILRAGQADWRVSSDRAGLERRNEDGAVTATTSLTGPAADDDVARHPTRHAQHPPLDRLRPSRQDADQPTPTGRSHRTHETPGQRHMSELISRTTRGVFRDLMTGSTVGEIGAAFQDELFAPNPDSTYQDTSSRRTLTQAYLEAIDWTDTEQVNRALRVFERLVHGFEPQSIGKFLHSLRRDGYNLDDETGHIQPIGPRFAPDSLRNITDASAIRQQLGRIQRAIVDDPALAVGSAKELIESTAKIVLRELGITIDEKAKLPALVREAQQALGLHGSSTIPGPDGSDAVKKILGSVSGIAIGLSELRNRGYGTGHGPASAPAGLGPRHAHLAVNAAFTWCQLMLDTLADKQAPWRKGTTGNSASAPRS